MTYSIVLGNVVAHKSIVISLLEKNFDIPNSARFSWIYENHPAGPPLFSLLRHEESKKFVGIRALFPRNILIEGRPVTAFIAGDFVVDKDHRSLVTARMLIKAAAAQCRTMDPCIILAVPNDKSGLVILRSGFKILASSPVMVCVLRTGRYLRRTLGKRVLANLLAIPLDAALRLRLVYFSLLESSQYLHEIISHFDERFESLWANMGKGFSFIGQRDNLYLNWRIGECPEGRNQIFTLLCGREGPVLGYVSYSISKGRASVTDLAFDGDWKNFRILMSRFCRYHSQLGTESITLSFVCCDSLIQHLKKMGFMVRGGMKQVMYYPSSEQVDAAVYLHAGDWYLTPVDNDV